MGGRRTLSISVLIPEALKFGLEMSEVSKISRDNVGDVTAAQVNEKIGV